MDRTSLHHIVVEPHADDAYLSLGGHIDAWVKAGQPVTIVTVYSGTRKRAADAQAYAQAVGAQWVGLGHVESGGVDSPPAEFSLWGSGLDLPNGVIYLPLGILHREHTHVREVFESQGHTIGGDHVLRYYLDQPYAITMSNNLLVNGRIWGMRVDSYLKPHARKYRHSKLFKDQSKFFYYNQDRLPQIVEMTFSGNPL